MLEETRSFCEATIAKCVSDDVARAEGLFADYEIIVVDDCSKDNTIGVVKAFQGKYKDCKVLLVPVTPNHGKGFAVRSGYFHASGDYVLMADGDNATKIDDVRKLFKELRGAKTATAGRAEPPTIAVGSRAHLEDVSIAKRTLSRTLLMRVFHFVVAVTYLCGTRGRKCQIRDTQCGFKLFNRQLCMCLFLSNRLERWAFDVELLICAAKADLRIVEVAVNWAEIPGSKVRLMGMVQMGLECLLMCFAYGIGFWGLKSTPVR